MGRGEERVERREEKEASVQPGCFWFPAPDSRLLQGELEGRGSGAVEFGRDLHHVGVTVSLKRCATDEGAIDIGLLHD